MGGRLSGRIADFGRGDEVLPESKVRALDTDERA